MIRHLNVLLGATFAVYVYRDLFPLATFAKPPLDIQEGWILWAKVVVLGMTGVLIPLMVPRQYVPIDPKV